MCLMFQETRFQIQVLKPYKSVQELSQKVLFIKAQQLISFEVLKDVKPVPQQLAR